MATLIQMTTEHVPVLAAELLELAAPQAGERAIDCTFGSGGHARLVGQELGESGSLTCIDRDPAAEERFHAVAQDVPCEMRFLREDFAHALANLAGEGAVADLIYMDLGISSPQVDDPGRGFSYSSDAPLDMRMDTTQPLSAADVVNEWPQERLAGILREFGEERHARAIAREVVARRPLTSTGELVDAVRASVPPSYRFGRGHPAKRTFQAIRIAVNGELDALERALPLAWGLLRPGGRLAAISFHSLEDRRMKRFLSERARGCICPPELPVCTCGHEPEAELMTRRPIAPSPEEVEQNPRAHSARLRVARKLDGAEG
jgi:16S rRNA (cytosine1402-N4)-methyltransferase